LLSGARKCNLVQNGGFEQGLTSWLGACNVGLSSPRCHEGLVAAALGKPDSRSPAKMFQDVNVCPGRSYRLQLSVAAAESEGDPGDLEVQVLWLGPCAELDPAIGCDPLVVQGKTTCCSWKTVVAYTGVVPFGTDTARICLKRLPAGSRRHKPCGDPCEEDSCGEEGCAEDLCEQGACEENSCRQDSCEAASVEEDSCQETSCGQDSRRKGPDCNYLLVDDVIFVERD